MQRDEDDTLVDVKFDRDPLDGLPGHLDVGTLEDSDFQTTCKNIFGATLVVVAGYVGWVALLS